MLTKRQGQRDDETWATESFSAHNQSPRGGQELPGTDGTEGRLMVQTICTKASIFVCDP